MRKFIDFLQDLAEDQRIPLQNRMVLGGLLIYLLTPLDIIPDWIPVLGWLDDAFVTILILDYIFNSADTELILEHYPWNKKSFRKMKNYVERLSFLIPPTVKRILFHHAAKLALKRQKEPDELSEGL